MHHVRDNRAFNKEKIMYAILRISYIHDYGAFVVRSGLCFLLLLFVLGRIATQRPDREAIAIRRVSDATRTVEDARDAFLVPVTGRHLATHQEVNASVNDGAVLVFRTQEGQDSPGGLYHTAFVLAQLFLYLQKQK